jgi:hypothetical protein
MNRSLKAMSMLERTLNRLHEARKPKEEFKKVLGEVIDKLAKATADACHQAMEEHVKVLDATADEYLGDRLRPASLMKRLSRFQAEWPDTLRTQMMAATVPIIREAQAALQ